MSELPRPMALDRIGPSGVTVTVEASPAELEAIARRLMLPAVTQLHCTFQVRRIAAGIFAADGVLEAVAEQVCVLSLDRFTQPIQEAFTIHFVPAGEEDDEPEPDAVDQIPYDSGAVDLGEAAIEQLALALDPYPRKPGATLECSPDTEAGAFGALAHLKPRLQD